MATGPIRLSDIKYSIYGGLRFNRNLYISADFYPSIGLVARDVNKLGLDLQNFHYPLEKSIRLVMLESIRKNFLQEGRPTKWEPLADYTVQVRGTEHPILYRTGNLQRAASSFSIWTITNTSATIRSLPSDVWYGALHQEGYGSIQNVARKLLPGGSASQIRALIKRLISGELHPTHMKRSTTFVIPARPFVLFQTEDIEAIQEIFIDWMEDQAEQVGRSWHGIP